MVVPQKIFITGITSDMMQRLVHLIDHNKYKIYGLTRSSKENVQHPKVHSVVGDLKDPTTFQDYLANCSMLIHGAAVTHSFKKDSYFEVNLKATKKLIDLAIQYDVKKIVFISSNTAGEKNGTYSLTKYLSENYLEKKFGNWLILRPSEIYGGNKREGIDKFISNLLKKSVVLYPTGVPEKLFPVFIEDVAEIMHQLIFDEKKANGKITICGPEGYSFLELINLVEQLKGKTIGILPVPKKIMFLTKEISEFSPFFMGIIPDQIPRLYGTKNLGSTEYRKGTEKIENYLKSISS